eukprot:TRINITY_DN32069_c0_g1_i1.p1 TRINITY_DN32069_c0_g1~~TRINITY_DN32069_c0_g1_i1.p1  ORF type:complete len:375 (+),score=113.86 TRINITY_DN32069_c0_g1_i1:52-1125(+)
MQRAAAAASLLAAAQGCSTALDCELLGDCVGGACVCDAGWTGATCSELKQGESSVVWPVSGGAASWGGSILKTADGVPHLFADVVCRKYTCAHTNSAQIIHAVSDGGVDGPYRYVDTVVPAEIENPHTAVAPDGTALLYFADHNYTFLNATCTGAVGSDPYPRDVKYMGLMYNDDFGGGGLWKYHFPEYTADMSPFLPLRNPSPLVLPNGTVLLAFRYNHVSPHIGESNGIAVADSWRGPYRLVSANATPAEQAEDPFLFSNGRGYHLVYHCYRGDVSGCHSYSPDAVTWTVSPNAAYTKQVAWRNGTTRMYDYRERPEIVFDGSAPVRLVTGVEWGNKRDDYPNCDSFTVATEILP